MPTLQFDSEGDPSRRAERGDQCHRRLRRACQWRGWKFRQHILADERLVQVIVADNGMGIPPEQLPKIFQVFVSGKGARGTGLGIAGESEDSERTRRANLVESEEGQRKQVYP